MSDKDIIYRQDAIDAVIDELKRIPTNAIRAKTRLEQLPSAHPEYTKNEEKVLTMMFQMLRMVLDLQDGYMDIDCTIFGRNELFDLSEKLGIDY